MAGKTLKECANAYFEQGHEAARKLLLESISSDARFNSRYFLTRSSEGKPYVRGDISKQESESILYSSFSPPPTWQAPYVVLKVKFDASEPTHYMSHAGEEILVPISGEVMYHFFTSNGCEQPSRKVLAKPVRSGEVIRINPQIPHHTWANRGTAEAWMFMRDISNEPYSLGTRPTFFIESTRGAKPKNEEDAVPRREKSAAELSNPEVYAMLAWGLSERIRNHRLRANLTVANVASICQVQPSLISRIEHANPSAKTPLRLIQQLCDVLRINLDPWRSSPWDLLRSSFASGEVANKQNYFSNEFSNSAGIHPQSRHHLEFRYLTIEAGKSLALRHPSDSSSKGNNSQQIKDEDSYLLSECAFATWTIISGEGIFECLPNFTEDKETRREVVTEGDVLHTRRQSEINVHALKHLQLIRVSYSPRTLRGESLPKIGSTNVVEK